MHIISRRGALGALIVMLTVPGVRAQEGTKSPSEPPKAPEALSSLKYRSVGPGWGGRASRVSGVAGGDALYVATASGGVWKSSDGGLSWAPVFDNQPISSIGAVAVAPSNPNVVYVGTGEANIRGNVAAGDGIYKSTDAGKTWTHVWKQEGQIGTVVVHPANADVAYAAVLGHAFGPNPERGVYRTRDGGRTWEQILKKDADTGASDVALDPSNPSIVFAGLWQARRRPWDLTSGGPGSGLYVSRDGGDTWKPLQGGGLPDGTWGKVGVAVAPSDGRRVYALIEAEKGGLFRSDDGGDTWTLATANRLIRQRPWYYSTLTVHPTNPNEVWFPQVPLLTTIDGGKTLEFVRGYAHGDHHDVWFDPKNPRRILIANDGGVELSQDGGQSWHSPRLPIGQFYHVSVDSRRPFRLAGALQDIGTAQGPSNSLHRAGITRADWYDVGGGEAGHVVSDPSDPDIVYAGEYLGIITRYDHRTRQARHVGAWPENPSGWGGEQMKYRFQWTAPIATSPHDPKVVYHGAQVIFRTADGGQSWTVISPDLTRNDKTRQQWSGGPITGDNTGVETYCTVFAIAESPKERGVIWAGSDDGLVHVTRDGGKTWNDVTAAMRGVPEWSTISIVEPSHFAGGTAYVVVDAHRLDDMRPYLYKTTDYGKTWTRLDARLPQDVYLHAVREDPTREGLLYLGTERGVRVSTDDGATWQPLQLNLPTVAVHDLAISGASLALATHGRSFWVLDDLVPVRELAKATGPAPHLFTTPDATAWRIGSGVRLPNSGTNPPQGALIYYYLPKKAEGEITLDISDAKGTVIRRLSSVPEPWDGSTDRAEDENEGALPTGAGVQRAVWDLRHQGAKTVKNAKIDLGDPKDGPYVLPGTYALKLTVGGQTTTGTVRVLGDPRVTLAAADLDRQLSFVLEVRDAINRLTGTVNALQSVREQLRSRRETLKATPGASELLPLADRIESALDKLEKEMQNPTAEVVYDILAMKSGAKLYSRMIPLYVYASDGVGAPTEGMRQVFDAQKAELAGLEATFTSLVKGDLANLNTRAATVGVPFVRVPERQ